MRWNEQFDILLQILDNTKIHLIPTLNPDGLRQSKGGNCDSVKGHKNKHGVDLDETFYSKFICVYFVECFGYGTSERQHCPFSCMSEPDFFL